MEWSRYWRSPERRLEAMHARFQEHAYHLHAHETYSFGVTDDGVQAFRCRGAGHHSAAGMVMAFNPDDPHDGRSADWTGFTYRMIHIGPELVTDAIGPLPLFDRPVLDDPVLAGRLRHLHATLLAGESRLQADEALDSAIAAMANRAATRRPRVRTGPSRQIAERARRVLEENADAGAEDLARTVGASRFTVYRAFGEAYGMAPSDYQRQLRLRSARRLIDRGRPIAEAAAEAGFADQSHFTRWFVRYYGITPGTYAKASLGRSRIVRSGER